MARLPNFLVIIRSEKLSGKGQGRGCLGVRKKERFVLGKRTFRSQKSKHFVLRIINTELDSVNEILIDETKHWLNDYPDSLKQYQSALDKFKGNIFERNLLDDLRLSLELLMKGILENEKSLENQLSDLGKFIQDRGGSKELGNMFQKLIEYFSKYQNSYVKHNDNVIEEEIEFVFEITSSFMKHFIRINKL